MSFRWVTQSPSEVFDGSGFDAAMLRTARRMQERLLDLAQEFTPVAEVPQGLSQTQFSGSRGRSPGTLRANWERGRIEPLPGGRILVTIVNDDPVGPHVEYPTRPHTISPSPDRAPASVPATGRRRKDGTDPQAALRFFSRGRWVFAAEVRHPGTRGSFMTHKAVEAMERFFDEIAAEGLREFFGEMVA